MIPNKNYVYYSFHIFTWFVNILKTRKIKERALCHFLVVFIVTKKCHEIKMRKLLAILRQILPLSLIFLLKNVS